MSQPLTSMIAPEVGGLAETSETVEIAYVDLPISIKVVLAKAQPTRPLSMGSNSKSSNFQGRREALPSCRDGR